MVGAFDTQTALSAFPILQRSIASSSVSSDFPYQVQIFYVMMAVNTLLLAALAVCSYYVWRLRPLGRLLSNVVFGAEIGYWLSRYAVKFALLEWRGDRAQLVRNSIAAVNALGNSGLSIQFDIWYPLIALVLLNFLYPRLRSANLDSVQAKSAETASS
jgi:hypothetical protein